MSIDIGYKNPGIVIIEKQEENVKLKIYQKIIITTNKDIVPYLDYFFSQNINYLIIERQITPKNISLMQFINGYATANKIEVIIKNPISTIRPTVQKVTRTEKKKFSVMLLNKYINDSLLDKKFKMKDSDICDATNIGLSFLFSINKKNLQDISIKIIEIKTVCITF